MKLSIVLPLHNQTQLKSLLNQIYDPESPDYRHFLSVAQFTEQFGPTAEDYQKVVDFARANRFAVDGAAPNRLVVPISGTVEQIQKTFNVRMCTYQHPTEKRTFFSADREPSVPSELAVTHIAGLNNYELPRSMVERPLSAGQKATNAQGSGPDGNYLPSDIRAAYYGGTALTGSGQSVALMQFGGYDVNDVVGNFNGAATASATGTNNYVLSYTPTVGGTTYSVLLKNILLDGQTLAPQGDDAEEALDIAQTVGMAPGLNQVNVYIGQSDEDILNAIASDDTANQISISWVWTPDDPEVDDFIFQEMAAQGQSVFAASGDYGAYTIYEPLFFPGEDDYVTAVGGTTLTTSGPGGAWQQETAWRQSGGGISPDWIPLPSWQQGVANSSNQASSIYRNVPDVAMEADYDNYSCNMGTCEGGWGGTSFASPRWAGYMALVNQAAQAQGQNTIGFLDPLIYAIGQGSEYSASFHDITLGYNDYIADQLNAPYYYAVPGYDLVTGWGSPMAGGQLVSLLAPGISTSFQLGLSPTHITIQPGGSGTSTITVNTPGGGSTPVTFSIDTLPPGIKAAFSQNPTATSSVLTVSVDLSTPRGSFLLKVTGTANAQVVFGYVAVEVNAPGMMVAPAGSPFTWTAPGYSSSVELDMSSFAGFDGVPFLSITSPLPAGITATLNPNTMSSPGYLNFKSHNSAYVHFKADNFTLPPGSISTGPVQVTAQAGNITDTHNVYLSVVPPIFEMDIQPNLTHLIQGGSLEMTVSAYAVGNYVSNFGNNPISLSTIAPLPAGVTASFNPSVIQIGQTSTMTVTASASAALGAFYISAQGYDSTTQEGTWLAFEMNVEAPPENPEFQVVPAVGFIAVPQGGSVTDHITVLQENGFNQQVWLDPGYVPGMSLDFGPGDAAGGRDVTFTSPSDLGSGIWLCSGMGYVGSDQESEHMWILATPVSPFTLNTQTGSLALYPGGSVSAPVSINPENGYTGAVSLSAIGLPEGINASFGANPTQENTTLTLTADASLAIGSYFVNISATANGQTLVRTIPIEVQSQVPAPTFSPAPGTYTSAQTVAISDSTPGAAIFYTTDGTTPTTGSTPYSSPITVSASETIEAIATASGYSQSPVASAAYAITIPTTTVLIISPSSTSLQAGSSYTLTATVTPSTGSTVPTGSMVFTIGAATQTVALNSSGVATYTGIAPSASGSLSLSAAYQGSAEFSTSTSNTLTESIVTIPTSTALTISPSATSLQAGSSYTLTATVTPSPGSTVPTGNVVFTIGSATQTVALNSSGVATYTGIAPSASGSLSFSAVYQGSAEFSPSTSSTLTESVITIPTSTALTISPSSTLLQAGSSYTLTATVTPSTGSTVPTGSVVFTIGSATQTVALNASGVATYTGTAPTASGSLSLSAAYQGSAEFSTSTSSTLTESIVTIPTSTALTISPSATSLRAGSSYTLTATVTPSAGSTVPTGSVVFTIGSATQTVALNASGVATYTGTAPTASGSLSLSAAYQGSTEFSSSTSNTLNESVVTNPVPSISSMSPAYVAAGGESFTITMNGSGFVNGSTVYWGNLSLATQFVSSTQLSAQVMATQIATTGTSVLTVQSPAPGGGASNTLQFEVDSVGAGSSTAPNFGTETASVSAGTTAAYPVTLPSSASDVSVACLNLPAGSSCTYSTTSGAVSITTSPSTPSGTFQVTVVFTETLPGSASASFVLAPFLLLPLLRLRRKIAIRKALIGACLILFLIGGASLATGCGGAAGPSQPIQSTYQVTNSGLVTLTVK